MDLSTGAVSAYYSNTDPSSVSVMTWDLPNTDTTLDDFTDTFLSWIESKDWSFGGGFREIVDDHYVNRDGSVGKHVSEE